MSRSVLSRRTVLRRSGAAVVAPFAGCLGMGDIPDLRMFNNAGRAVTVTTRVERLDRSEAVFSDTTTIPADGERRYQNPVREAGMVRMRVSVEGGPENTYEWDAPADESYGLTVHLSADEVSFGRVVS